MFGRYLRALPRLLRTPMGPEEAAARIADQLARREQNFVRFLRECVYPNPQSPYPALFASAGAELGDLERMIADDGIEPTLGRLYDEGVRITLDEFKGNVPIERQGVSLRPSALMFENPKPAHGIGSSGGSGKATRVAVHMGMLEHDTAYQSLFFDAFGLHGRPILVYRVIPPSRAGVNIVLRQAKIGEPAKRWLSPHRGGRDAESIKFAAFTWATLLVARASGVPVTRPRHCPSSEAVRVARWLAERCAEGTPGILDTQAALAVRVCQAARDEGLDISGTFIRTGGEPLTPGKQEVIRAAGCRAVSHYTMSETQRIGSACADPVGPNDHHFLSDKLAVLQRPVSVGGDGDTVGAFVFTTLLPYAGKVMINVESGDYGELVERDCGCPLGALGLTTHLNDIHSYNKLTAEGNHFLGNDLIELVDEALPRRFGGGPTDYQLVEEEVGGLPKVTVVVRPGVGAVDDSEVVSFVLDHLSATQRNRLMTEVWRDGDTLRVARREPYASRPAGKILPLMVMNGGRSR
jgi:hypothetical protein